MNNPNGNPNTNFPPNYPRNNPNNMGNQCAGQPPMGYPGPQPMGPQNMGYPGNPQMGQQPMGPHQPNQQKKGNEFTSRINATTTKSNSKPIASYLYFITLRTSKKIGNYVLLGIHLLLLLLILIIPRIMLEANAFSADPLWGVKELVSTIKGCMIGAIAVNAIFLSIFALKLTFSIFLSNKEDGTEILIVSKPITRNQIFLTRIIFLIITFIIYSIAILIIVGIGIGVVGPKYFDSGLVNPNINAAIAVFSFLGGSFLALISIAAIGLLFSTFMGSKGAQAVSSVIIFTSIAYTATFDMQNGLTILFAQNNVIPKYNNDGTTNTEWVKYDKSGVRVLKQLNENKDFSTFLKTIKLPNNFDYNRQNINLQPNTNLQLSSFKFNGGNNNYYGNQSNINPLFYFTSWEMYLSTDKLLQLSDPNSYPNGDNYLSICIKYENLNDPNSSKIESNNISLRVYYGLSGYNTSLPDGSFSCSYFQSTTLDNFLFPEYNSPIEKIAQKAIPLINDNIGNLKAELNPGFNLSGIATFSYLLPTSASSILSGISNYNNVIDGSNSGVALDIYHKYDLAVNTGPINTFIYTNFDGDKSKPKLQFKLNNIESINIQSTDIMPQYAPLILWLFITTGILALAWFLYRRKDFQ